jgi:ferredoxin
MKRPGDPRRPGFEDCTGCRVCVLPCPVWRQTHDVTLTVAGRAKALQRGYGAEEIRDSLEACVLCGACEAVCPVGIDTVGMTLDLRARLAEAGGSALATAAAGLLAGAVSTGPGSAPASASALGVAGDAAATAGVANTERAGHAVAAAMAAGSAAASARDVAPASPASGQAWFLPGLALRADAPLLRRVVALLARQGVGLAADDGADLRIALEAGLALDGERRERFLGPLRGARELVVADGLLHRPLREWLPGARIIGLGEALLRLGPTLRPSDLLIIETRGFHADFARLVRTYDALRQSTGCCMNLDLQRAAIPTGAASLQAIAGRSDLDVADQVRWILEGRRIERVIVEDVADRAPVALTTGRPVLHLAELVPGELP